jgi:hypothetical protein
MFWQVGFTTSLHHHPQIQGMVKCEYVINTSIQVLLGLKIFKGENCKMVILSIF